MLLTRRARNLILGLLLVLAQTLAAAHAIGHGLGQDEGGAPNPVCEWCAAFGHLGAALPGGAVSLPAPPIAWIATAAPGFALHLPLCLAYRSQAPPRIS